MTPRYSVAYRDTGHPFRCFVHFGQWRPHEGGDGVHWSPGGGRAGNDSRSATYDVALSDSGFSPGILDV